MKLPYGVTGFWLVGDEMPNSAIDGKTFKRACYTVARELEAKLMECKTDMVYPINHYSALFEFREKRILVLCNPNYGYIAFAHENFYRAEFLDEPNFARAFAAVDGFHVLTRELLETFPEGEHLTELNKAELAQIKHWRPKRLGDIIFNWWD